MVLVYAFSVAVDYSSDKNWGTADRTVVEYLTYPWFSFKGSVTVIWDAITGNHR